MIGATARTDLSLWQIWHNRNRARGMWFDMALAQYGLFLPEVVVSRDIFRLIIVLMLGRGVMASGNWLDIEISLSYNVALDNGTMAINGVGRRTMEFLTGGDIVGINYEGLKKFAPQERGSDNA